MIEKTRIFIVDDDEDAKQPYEMTFADSEFELTYVTSPLDAIRLLDAKPNPADVILLDLAMSRMDGLTLAEQIRINEIKNKVRPARLAYFTSWDMNRVKKHAEDEDDYDYGVETVFQKPIAPDELLRRLREWLTKPAQSKRRVTGVENFYPQNGAVLPTMTTALIGIVVLIVTITIYNRVLHTREEEYAYQFLEQKKKFEQMTGICNENWRTDATLQKWLGQQNITPPPEYLIQKPCLVEKKGE